MGLFAYPWSSWKAKLTERFPPIFELLNTAPGFTPGSFAMWPAIPNPSKNWSPYDEYLPGLEGIELSSRQPSCIDKQIRGNSIVVGSCDVGIGQIRPMFNVQHAKQLGLTC
jgi:hypothetical protein